MTCHRPTCASAGAPLNRSRRVRHVRIAEPSHLRDEPVREDSRHGAHRLSRRRQDDAAQPHPDREPRQALRRDRQRVRRDRHRQRPRRRRRRRGVRDEQRLRLLHGARRPDPDHGRAGQAPGQVRRDHRRDHRAGRPGARGPDLLRRPGRGRGRPPRRGGDGRRRQVAVRAPEGRPGGEEPGRLRRRDPAQQGRPRLGGGPRPASRARSARSTPTPSSTAPRTATCRSTRCSAATRST